ncbi:MAG: MATE family efflux transporter, partial [Gemmatimonadota bacterium]
MMGSPIAIGDGASPFRLELRALLALAGPVVVMQVGLMLMGVADTIMVGRLSGEALAAVALGNLYFVLATIFGMGTLLALDPVVAQAVGAGDDVGVARALQRGLLLALLLSVPTMLLLAPGEWILSRLGQPATIVPVAAAYTRATIVGVFPVFVFIVLRHTLQSLSRLAPVVTVILLANLLNVGLNWALIYGRLGLPALGAVGTGWASSISRVFLALGLLALAWRPLRPYLSPLPPTTRRLAPLARMAALGVPIGGQFVLEFGAFGLVAVFMGWIGVAAMGAHQIVISFASLTYMVPSGVAAAAAVRVGQAVGRGSAEDARRAAGAAILCGTGFMVLSAIALLVAPRAIAGIYTSDVAVTAIAMVLIPIAGLFQIFDGAQVVACGILRGLGDTRVPFLIIALGYWLVAIPISVALGLWADRGPA